MAILKNTTLVNSGNTGWTRTNVLDALEEAISFLNDKTTLLVLGKGHEKHQEIGDRILDFDDVVVIKDILGSK